MTLENAQLRRVDRMNNTAFLREGIMQNKKTYRIAQIGTFDCKNYGDILFPDVLSTELAKRLNVEEIILFSPIGGMKPFDNRVVVPLADLEKEHLKKPFDAFICGGGDILRLDTNLVRNRSKYDMNGTGADMWLYPMMLGKKYHIPVLLNAPGAPSRFWGNEKEMARIAFREIDYICTRDSRSAGLLNECTDEDVKVTPDSIFLIQQTYSDSELEKTYAHLKKEIGIPEHFFVFQMCAFEDQLPVIAYEEKLREIETWLDARCVFMPIGYVHNDVEVLKELNQAVSRPFYMIERELAPVEMLSVLRKAKCFVGTSMHGCLTSMVFQTPTITINSFQSIKLHGLFELAELSQCDVNSIREIHKDLMLYVLTDERKSEIVYLANEHFDEMTRIIKRGYTKKNIHKGESNDIHELLRLILQPDSCVPSFSKLYYRAADDYNERNSIILPFPAASHQINFTVNIPQNSCEIRFDPVENYSCIVSDLQIRCAGDTLKIDASNGYKLDDVFVFTSTDPQIGVRLPETHDGNLQISCTIFLLKGMEGLAEKVVETMKEQHSVNEEQLLTYQQEKKQIQELLDQKEKELRELNQRYIQMENLYRQLVQQHNTILESACWKITKPVRKALDSLKKNKQTGLVIKGVKYLKVFGIKKTLQKIREHAKSHKHVRIKNVIEYRDLQQMIEHMKSMESDHTGVRLYQPNVLAAYGKKKDIKKILLASHELELTGGPMAVRYFSKCLIEQGYAPVVISPKDGNLAQTLKTDGIPVIVYPSLYENTQVVYIAKLFDLLVLNTIVSAPIVNMLSGVDIPILWWIHEARASYCSKALEQMPEYVSESVTIRTGGLYAARMLSEYRPGYKHENLLYCLPEQQDENEVYQLPEHSNGKIIMAVIGQLDERKGQKILAKAICMLSKSVREKCFFVFVGKKAEKTTCECVEAVVKKYPNNVCHIDEVTPMELQAIYKQIDCLICSSTDDPMPIVVTQAWMNKKMVICSEYTGSAELIRKENAGYVYCNNDEGELATCIERYVKSPDKHIHMKEAGRKIYEQEFSIDAFRKNAISLVEQMQDEQASQKNEGDEASDGSVSIVIPTYNAGKQWKEFLRRVTAQKGVKSIEMVVVDSGSRDQTVALSKEYGANVIEIPKEKFSHSYARNLGAENAHGDIVIFMTQDALPSDDEWVKNMVQPIITGEATAVSCKEQCPEGTELYYRANSWGHAQFQGILEHDQLGVKKRDESIAQLRPHASLNDIACAIKKRIFKKFYYRFDYGEDLDLGIRLLQNGYTIKLLAFPTVIHGHNRTAGYNLKRGYVESIAMGKMNEAWTPLKENECEVARKIIRGTEILNAAIEQTRRECEKTIDRDAFFALFQKNLSKYANANDSKTQSFKMAIDDPVLTQCNQIMQPYMGKHSNDDCEILNNTAEYLVVLLLPYFNYLGISELDYTLQEQVYECTIKRYCMMVGGALARIDVKSASYEQIQQMTRGV